MRGDDEEDVLGLQVTTSILDEGPSSNGEERWIWHREGLVPRCQERS